MEIIATWLPPAAIIAVILFTNNQLNKRIDDLRDHLRDQMELGDKRLAEKIDSVKEDVLILRRDVGSLRQDFIRHLESHNASEKKE